MTVSGDGSMMQGGDAAFGKLIDGVVSEDSLAELIWNNTEESGKKLPLSVDFKFNKPQSISNITVFNRPQYTNGKIKKLSIKGFGVDGTEYDLGTKTVEPNEAYVKFDIDPINELSKVQVVFEESHSGPLMLSVAEVEFIAKTNNEPEKPSVDKTALENKIKEAEAIDLAKYTDKSVSEFNEKLSIAKEVLANEASSQDEVNKALEDLNKAIDKLEVKEESSKPSKPSEPSEPSNPSGDSSDGETVKTGDTQGSKILLFGSLAIIAGVAGVYFRKKKTVE